MTGPGNPLEASTTVRFRDRHRDLLPRFRREMEDWFQSMASFDDPVQRQRAMDRLEDAVSERTEQASTHLFPKPAWAG
jgi:hypothetical protein